MRRPEEEGRGRQPARPPGARASSASSSAAPRDGSGSGDPVPAAGGAGASRAATKAEPRTGWGGARRAHPPRPPGKQGRVARPTLTGSHGPAAVEPRRTGPGRARPERREPGAATAAEAAGRRWSRPALLPPAERCPQPGSAGRAGVTSGLGSGSGRRGRDRPWALFLLGRRLTVARPPSPTWARRLGGARGPRRRGCGASPRGVDSGAG